MRRLILFRHGKTEDRRPGVDDAARQLTERGRADSLRVAEALAARGLLPDLVLVSPAERARQTLDAAAPALCSPAVEVRPGLYDATAEEVAVEVGAGTAEHAVIMVVGHNPSLQDLAVSLLEDGAADGRDVESIACGFPTATAAVLAVDAAGARLEALVLARDHRPADEPR